MTLTTQEKNELLEHITLGTNDVFYFSYNSGTEPLPLRPLTSLELDNCFYDSLDQAPIGVARLVIKLKLGLIEKDQEVRNIKNEHYSKLQRFHDLIDYYVVYHGMKDFQSEKFRKPNENGIPNGISIVQEMNDVHKIASDILSRSHQPQDVIKQVFYDEKGKELAMKITYLHQPLDKICNLTKLQEDFLVYSKGHLESVMRGVQKEKEILSSDDVIKVKDILGGI